MENLRIDDAITIPAGNLNATAVRSGGPGGQNVNKVATKVILTFDLPGCGVLTAAVKARLRQAAGRRIDRAGFLHVTSQLHRTREQNLEECRRRLCALIRSALVSPKQRKKTRPPAWSDAGRLEAKRRASRKKQLRKPPDDEA
jgi:ribosome-associated protein